MGHRQLGALEGSISVLVCMYVNRELAALSAEFSWVWSIHHETLVSSCRGAMLNHLTCWVHTS